MLLHPLILAQPDVAEDDVGPTAVALQVNEQSSKDAYQSQWREHPQLLSALSAAALLHLQLLLGIVNLRALLQPLLLLLAAFLDLLL